MKNQPSTLQRAAQNDKSDKALPAPCLIKITKNTVSMCFPFLIRRNLSLIELPTQLNIGVRLGIKRMAVHAYTRSKQ